MNGDKFGLGRVRAGLARHKKKILAIIFIALLAGLGWLGYAYYQENIRTILKVGDVSFTQREYKRLVEQAKDQQIAEEAVAERLILMQKTISAAKQLNITVTDSERERIIRSNYGDKTLSELNEWQKLFLEKAVLDAKVQLLKTGGYTGALYEFPFSRNFDTFDPTAESSDFGKPEAIAADKKYADEQAKSYREKIINKSITPTQAIKELSENERLVLGSSGNKSQEFTVNKEGREVSGQHTGRRVAVDFLPELSVLKQGEVSKIQTKKMLLSYYAKSDKKEPKEVAYFFVQLSSVVDARPSIEKDLQNIESSIKVDKAI